MSLNKRYVMKYLNVIQNIWNKLLVLLSYTSIYNFTISYQFVYVFLKLTVSFFNNNAIPKWYSLKYILTYFKYLDAVIIDTPNNYNKCDNVSLVIRNIWEKIVCSSFNKTTPLKVRFVDLHLIHVII
jgi:hypothetical protein